MKLKLLLFIGLLLCVACKKDKKQAPVTYSVIGAWTLAAYQTNFGIGVNATVAQYPCMVYNVLTFYRDSTSSSSYSGIDTCFITPTQSFAAGAQDYGVPGTLPLLATWRQNGNNVYVLNQGTTKPVSGLISNVNGRLQLDLRDTAIIDGKAYYVHSVMVQ